MTTPPAVTLMVLYAQSERGTDGPSWIVVAIGVAVVVGLASALKSRGGIGATGDRAFDDRTFDDRISDDRTSDE